MMTERQTLAIVEVGEGYTDRLRTVEVNNCSMSQAQQLAKDLGYQVIADLCTIVDTIDSVHIIVTVDPKEEVKQ